MRGPFITESQAAAIKKAWWRKARVELVLWALAFSVGFALLHDPLEACRWPWWVYGAIVWASLLLFSRLALWVTFTLAAVAHAIGWGAYSLGYPIYPPVTGYFLVACVLAIVIRSPIGLFVLLSMADSVKAGASHRHGAGLVEEPVEYDPSTDEDVYANGRREPAFLKPKKSGGGDHEEDYRRW
jgi:hypothetical protein